METDKEKEKVTHWAGFVETWSSASWEKEMGIDRVKVKESPWETQEEMVLWEKLEVSEKVQMGRSMERVREAGRS